MAKTLVLVVDDEPSIRAVLREALEEEGYAALQASSGISALDVLRSGAQIDLLITDIGLLDGMNGRELAKAARRARPSLKVLLITGYGEQRITRDGPCNLANMLL